MTPKTTSLLLAVMAMACPNEQALARKPSAEEMEMRLRWSSENLGAQAPVPPFSFMYDGQQLFHGYGGLSIPVDQLKTWKIERSTKDLDDYRTQQTLIYTEPK